MSVFRPNSLTATNGLAFQGQQIASLYQQYYKNISPRLGASYSAHPPTPSSAQAYGFYFDTPNLNPFLDNRPGNAAPNGVGRQSRRSQPRSTPSPPASAVPRPPSQGQAIFPSSRQLSLHVHSNLRRLLRRSQLPPLV